MIRILPSHIAARIAAGEVVERPASVVKELVDNALDAGARSLEIVVVNSGFASIGVRDDGMGMGPDDLVLCVQRHATSKLQNDEISNIATLGYRGEALPSIASVARLSVRSKRREDDIASQVTVLDGQLQDCRPARGAVGTQVEVTDIFASHPARLKFMKSPRREASAIRDVVKAAALSWPHVDFLLDLNGSRSRYARCSNHGERACQVLDIAREDAVTVDHCMEGISVRGLLTLPTANIRSNNLRIAVNGRPIFDEQVRAAVLSAYASMIGPSACTKGSILIEVDPRDVDVNVHPRKAEVRLRDPRQVASRVSEAVSKALSSAGLVSPSSLAVLARDFAEARHDEAVDYRRYPLGRFLGQAHGTWIICETADGIALIDQHAAHERVIMERLRKALGGTPPSPVELAVPFSWSCDQAKAAEILDAQEELKAQGLVVDDWEEGFILKARPKALAEIAPHTICAALEEAICSGSSSRAIDIALWESIATAACKAAMKAGDALTPERATALLREMESVPNAGWCNHGRPTVVYLQDLDMRKLFAR